MAFTQIVAPTLRELFLQQILEQIFSGELKPGDKLPTERELAETMGVSRSMVHLGIEDLERMGFISIIPRKGNYVIDFWKNGNLETLRGIAKYSRDKIDNNMLISYVEMRNAVVGGAMKRIALEKDEKSLAAVDEQLENLKKAFARDCGESSTAAEDVRKFEISLCAICGNYFFPLVMNSFADSGLSIWQRCCEFWGPEEMICDMEKLVDMMHAGQGDECQRFLEKRFEYVIKTKGYMR